MPLLVVVVTSAEDLASALRMRRLPDFFELRLDALWDALPLVEMAKEKLRAPLIVTARHPAEGGLHDLSSMERRDVLLRFLPGAAFVDIELRGTAELKPVLATAGRRGINRIISFHDAGRTPSVRELAELAHLAAAVKADVFKVATRTDREEDVARLLEFLELECGKIPISAMGLGKLGRSARRQLVQRGSALNYAPLGNARIEGQLSLREMRLAI
ncbi:MAG: type I 3-dehydroquinate dehydratase, partial [Chthoniobacterales bacterium]|nr:type I 3-dehydroquinate dehydratase [Chthoniobacterales bacterium]